MRYAQGSGIGKTIHIRTSDQHGTSPQGDSLEHVGARRIPPSTNSGRSPASASAMRGSMVAVAGAVSRLRSSISFSVTTVTDWGISRSSWLPLPMVERVARTESLPSAAAAFSLITTGARVLPSTCVDDCVDEVALVSPVAGVVAVCAQPETDTASISAPSGSRAGLDDADGLVVAMATGDRRIFVLRAERAARAEGCAKLASRRDPPGRRWIGFREIAWLCSKQSLKGASWLADKVQYKV